MISVYTAQSQEPSAGPVCLDGAEAYLELKPASRAPPPLSPLLLLSSWPSWAGQWNGRRWSRVSKPAASILLPGGAGRPGPPWFYLPQSHSEVWEPLPGGRAFSSLSGGWESPQGRPFERCGCSVSVLPGGQPVISRFTGLVEIASRKWGHRGNYKRLLH